MGLPLLLSSTSLTGTAKATEPGSHSLTTRLAAMLDKRKLSPIPLQLMNGVRIPVDIF